MAKRVDANQASIVKVFRGLGVSVQHLSDVGKGCPDLLLGIFGKNYLVELKNGSRPPSGQKLTPHEETFFMTWKGQVSIIKSEDEAINFITSIIRENTK